MGQTGIADSKSTIRNSKVIGFCAAPELGEPPAPIEVLQIGYSDGTDTGMVVKIPTNPLRGSSNPSQSNIAKSPSFDRKQKDIAKSPENAIKPSSTDSSSSRPAPANPNNELDIPGTKEVVSNSKPESESSAKTESNSLKAESSVTSKIQPPSEDDAPELMEERAAIDLASAMEEPPEEELEEGDSDKPSSDAEDSETESTEASMSISDEDGEQEGLEESKTDSEIEPPHSRQPRTNTQKAQEEPELSSDDVSSKEKAEEEKKEAASAVRKMKVPVAEIKADKKIVRDTSPQSAPKRNLPLNQQQQKLRNRIDTCLAYYLFRPESVAKRSPWAVMHAMLPYGVEGELIAGNERVNAIGWMCYNGKCRTQRLFLPKGNSFTMAVGPGVQGHEGQLLAMLAQSYVPSSYPIQVEGKSYTVGDLIRYEMYSCKEKTELTFKLIGLSHYLPSDQTWQTSDKKIWSISKLIEEELDQPIVGAACGGTHRLMGLTYAVQRREEQGLPIDDNFFRAKKFVTDFVDYAFTLQNPDGSFSTDWFERRANESDMDRKVQTTGHILEWLIYTLPEDRLNDPRITRSVQFLISQLLDRREHDWAIGPRGHSLRALALYDQKVFGAVPGQRREQLAGFLKYAPVRR